MTQTAEPASEPLRFHIRINPGNVNLVPGNFEYEARRAAMLAIREAKYIEGLQAQAAVDELDFLPGDDTQDRVIAAEAGRLARRDFDVAAVLGGWGLSAEGIIFHGAGITYTMDEAVLLGDCAIEGGQELAEAFSQLQVLAATN
jgi:hypothetical protein